MDLDFESHNEKLLLKEEETTHNSNPSQKINGTQLHTHYLETPFIAKVNAGSGILLKIIGVANVIDLEIDCIIEKKKAVQPCFF